MPAAMKHLLAAGLLLALLLALVPRNVSSSPYLYDEADYMYAASLGYFANWTDTPTLSLPNFFRIGLGRGGQSGSRQGLSEFIRQSNDAVFYRHWHGPLYHYFLIPVSRWGLSEHGVRSAMLFVPALAVLAIYFGCLWLIPGSAGAVTGFLSGMLFLTSFTVTRSTELAPHQLFAFCFICSLVFLAKTVATGLHPYWYAAVVMAALAFCTLEVAFVLVLTLVMCAYFERGRLRANWRFAAKSAAAFAGTVAIVWPAALYKLSFIKAYAFMAYLAVIRKAAWGNAGFQETWGSRLLNSPLEWAVIIAALIIYLGRRKRKENRIAYPMLIYAALMIGATLKVFSETPRYALPFMPALDLFAGIVLTTLLALRWKPAGVAAAVVLLVGLYVEAVTQALRHPIHPEPRPPAVLALVRESNLVNQALLVPQDDLPMLHYYFPATRLRGYYTEVPAPSDLEGFRADAVLYPGYPVRLDRTHAD